MDEVIPSNSRYIPLTQQKYCCVPTCIQMVVYRHGIPLVSAEALGYELGLTVPEEERELFWNARTGEKPTAGWGTQIGEQQYSPNAAFTRLGIPLSMSLDLIDSFDSIESMMKYLTDAENRGSDILVCYDYGALFDTDSHVGHVNVFDRIIDGKVRLVDPEQNVPKWRGVEPGALFDAMKRHGAEKSGGFWKLSSHS
jgi:hypothetical protein